MPLSVTEHHHWRLERRRSALGTPGIRRLDWVLRLGACGQLTTLAPGSTHALDLEKNGRGRQDWPPALLFPSFEKPIEHWAWAGHARAGRRHNLGTS